MVMSSRLFLTNLTTAEILVDILLYTVVATAAAWVIAFYVEKHAVYIYIYEFSVGLIV